MRQFANFYLLLIIFENRVIFAIIINLTMGNLMNKKYIAMTLALSSQFYCGISAMEIGVRRIIANVYINLDALEEMSDPRPIKRPLSLQALALAATVQAINSGIVRLEDAKKLPCGGFSPETINLIKTLSDITKLDIFTEKNTLTFHLAKIILQSSLLTEALIALANDKQRDKLLDGKQLVKFLLQFEQELETSDCLNIQGETREEFINYDLTDTRNLLISRGVFKPEIDTISKLFPNGLPSAIPMISHLFSKTEDKKFVVNINIHE